MGFEIIISGGKLRVSGNDSLMITKGECIVDTGNTNSRDNK